MSRFNGGKGIQNVPLLQSAFRNAADIADKTSQEILTDDFTTLDAWAIAGTVTATDNVATLTDAGALLLGRTETYFGRQLNPYTIEVDLSVTGIKSLAQIYSDTGALLDRVTIGADNTLLHYVDAAVSSVSVTPSNFDASKKFKLMWHIQPKEKLIQLYLYYNDSVSNATTIVKIDGEKSYTAEIPNRLRFETDSAGTGTMTVENLRVYEVWGVSAGDSILSGHPGYDPSPGHYNRSSSGFNDETSQIQYWIEQYAGGNRRVLNQGIGGHNTIDLLNRHQNVVIDLKPKIAIYWIGTNDITVNSLSVDDAKANVRQVLENTVNAGIGTVMINCAPRENMEDSEDITKHEWNDWLKNLCAKLNVHYADVHDLLADPANNDMPYAPYNADGTHFNAYGYKVAAQEIWRSLTDFNS